MKNIHNPSKIFWFVSLPQTILAIGLIALLAGRWHTGALWTLIVSAAVNAAFTVYGISRRKQPAIHKAVPIMLAAAGCSLLTLSASLLGGVALYGFSLRLAALALNGITALYAVAALAKSLKPRADAGTRVIAMVALPFAWFLAFNIATGIRLNTAVIILIVAGGLAAAYLLIRIVLERGAEKEGLTAPGPKKYALIVLYSLFSIGLPLIGLTLNVSLGNLFGDFSSPWFFVIPIINGVLLLCPPFSDKRLRLLRFVLLSAAFVYFVYFFIVFIPFMPVGLYGLMFVVGFLVFAPVGALTMQIIALNRERRQLFPVWGGARLILSFVLALLLIPACLLTGVIGDRLNLDNAITYLETSEAVSGVSVDIGRLERTLNNASATFEISRRRFTAFETVSNTPILSAAYSALVLNGKMMKDSEIERLRRLFFDESVSAQESITDGLTVDGGNRTDVRLTDVTTETVYDEKAGVNRTWVNLTLQGGENRVGDEYITLFILPDGAYISDYYLDVGFERKYGILADERAAMSVYENIVRVRRDPGVIRYVNDRQLELRVFPFGIGEIRRTGFEIMHSQGFAFALDDRVVTLDAVRTSEEVSFQGGVLLSDALKQTLPMAGERERSYYFIIDSSAHSSINYQLGLIHDYASMNGVSDARVIFASYDLTEAALSDARNVSVAPRCGFNLALAVKEILTKNGDDTVPIILFTSSNPAGAVWPENSAWLARRFPDNPYYYRLRDDLTLVPYAFIGNLAEAPVTEPIVAPLRSYQNTYVRDDGQSEIVGRSDPGGLLITGNQYADALAIDITLRAHPSMDAGASLTMLRASFRSHVLTQQTAFIVLETSDQEAELLRTQELLLEQDSAAARESLDEPPALLLIACFVGMVCVLLLARRRGRRGDYQPPPQGDAGT